VIDTSNYTVVKNDNFTTDTSLNKSIWSGFNGSSSALTFSSAGATLSSNASNNFGSVGFHGGETDSNAIYNAATGNYSEYGLTYGDTYGLYQATASVAVAAPGPGLLLWPANNVWPGSEVDMLEINSQGLAYATVHNMDPSTGNDQYTSYYLNIDPTKANTYAVDWEPGSLTYYVNGQQIFSIAAHVPLVPLSFGAQGGTSGGVANSITLSNYSFSKVNSLALDSSEQAAAGTSSLFKNTYSGEKPNTDNATIVGTGPDNVTLLMAEDAYNGDAQFTVSVDGK
jgi:beta-glucanase (GH16 family)